MGIGNHRTPALLPRAAALITPHGDRKQHGQPGHHGRDRLITPHSWGSETVLRSRVRDRHRVSLPLMGIGNTVSGLPSASTTFTVSLPLMGIGNPPRPPAGCVVAVFVLITPHGDRKQLNASDLIGKICDSLPLMGSETPRRPRRARPPRRSPSAHYPSWGSETCAVVRTPASRSRAHYPSWGSETCPC